MILCLLLFLDRHCCSVDINQLVDFFYVSIEMRAGWNGRFSRGSPHEGRGHRAGVERVCRFVKSWSSLLRVDVVSTRWWHRIYFFFISLSLSLSRRNSKRSASWSDERAGMLIAIVRIPRVRFTVQFQVKISKVLYCDCDGDCDVFHKHTHSEWEKEGLLRSPHEIKCTTLLVKQFRQGILISTWFGFRNYVFCLATLAVCSNSSVQSRPSQQQNPPPPKENK